jgi:flagellar basal-body rod protein FlgC
MPLNGIFRGMAISQSAMSAEQRRMTVASKNLAHAGSTEKRANGLPYARQRVHFQEVLNKVGEGTGRVQTEIVESARYTQRYEPDHPHADPETGIVVESDIDPILELTDMMVAGRAYDANTNAVRGFMKMHESALRLGEA